MVMVTRLLTTNLARPSISLHLYCGTLVGESTK